ncbi:eukaryotic translation initiation factor 4E-binding protein 1-like [Actinia tenebrosa]|uniref:Eukaryotic translation initiation factor 4E-binding protein 1-like n=1 Tax=Actinia tenebrosa TaxID=6105 RepID=A0A6P8H5T2_ACTTE|nr:eukaryotic translation initiation factor 4E-binding protein 1-like [Actinia tenebrosa]
MNGISTASTTPLSRAIPSRRIPVHDPSQMPMDYSTTPGGTIYSTTPGGTRIIYDRKFLMELRNSPLSNTPPANLPFIPGVTSEDNAKPEENVKPASLPERKPDSGDEPQFQMEI